MRPIPEAIAAVLERIVRLPDDAVPIAIARGRILAREVIAERALPGVDNSAMDGYAVRVADLPGALTVVGTAGAGDPWPHALEPGTAVRILTGAPLPVGADTVVIQEDVTRDGDLVTCPVAPVGDNVRRAGSDIAIGTRAIAAGTRIGVPEIGLLAALGVALVWVGRRPRVALVSTGDELIEIGVEPQPGQIVDSSSYALAAAIRDAGGEPIRLGIARDDEGAVTSMITSALTADAVITTGGVSVGDRDVVRPALEAAGVELELWKVAMKPGKPFAFGMHDRTPVFALPGNPVSTLVAFELFVRPALLAMQGATVTRRPRVPVRLRGAYTKQAGRAHLLTSKLERVGDQLFATPIVPQGSAMMTSLIGCQALVEIPADATAVADGAACTAILVEAV